MQMTNFDFIKEMQETNEANINACVDILINSVKAKYLYKKGGWGMVHVEFKVENKDYINPNFSINDTALGCALDIEIGFITDNMKEIEKRVNEKLGVKAIEYRIDRRDNYFVILL
jgi:hypothetical protein